MLPPFSRDPLVAGADQVATRPGRERAGYGGFQIESRLQRRTCNRLDLHRQDFVEGKRRSGLADEIDMPVSITTSTLELTQISTNLGGTISGKFKIHTTAFDEEKNP
jgi:hypothetical protein